MKVRRKAREIAFRVLFAVDTGKNTVPDAFIPFRYEDPIANEYALKLVIGSLDIINEIDVKITSFLENWTLERINAIDKQLLRLAIFEIDNFEDVEDGIVVYEAVELAKKYGDENSPSFINGILRNYLRSKSDAGKT
jgi:N utilization substance protein B